MSAPRRVLEAPNAGGRPGATPFAVWLALLAITLAAAFLRLSWIGISPPGLNQDEAIGAWISWCMLHGGRDLNGLAWPVFQSAGIGDHPSTLYFYVLMPFQALGGLGVWTTRLPVGIAGTLCVPLAYAIGARLFGRAAGLMAAAVLALNPWHMYLSRLGVGAGLCPLQALLTLWLLLEAGFPIADRPGQRPRATWAALAGLSAGIACYGFHPMRLYFPALFALLLAMNPRGWWNLARAPAGRSALIALAAGFALTFGPLAWQHVVDPTIAQRWQMTRLWAPGTPLPEIARLVLERWWLHFGPDFLFARGDHFEIMRLPGQGVFPLYLAPFLAAGAVLALVRARRSLSSRLLLALVALYPAGDVISRYDSVHLLRSAPGVGALALLSASGLAAAWGWLRRVGPSAALPAALALALVASAWEARYLGRFFGSWNREPLIYHGYYQDLLGACAWLRPRLERYDVVVWTTQGLAEPFAVTLVALGWEPERWFREPRDRRTRGDFDVYVRYGPMFFLYDDWPRPALDALQADRRVQRALFVVRPHELGLEHPVHVIRGPLGEALWLVEAEL